MTEVDLPVPVLTMPHWRVNFRPESYDPDRLPNLDLCLALVRGTKLSLRGWDYPHLSQKYNQIGYGETWVASWVNFLNHIEYWRLYQSGQFLHLFAVREAAEPQWRLQLHAAARSHAYGTEEIDWNAVPGYFSLVNFVYTVTEIFEFAARLAQRELYHGSLSITITLRNIHGFVLTPEVGRVWSGVRRATTAHIGHTWHIDSRDLIASSAELARTATGWFFERFGWSNPSLEVIRKDQERFLSGRL